MAVSSKSMLNEFCQVRRLVLPAYDTKFHGPPHARLFQSIVTISDQAFAGEECTTKKAAEQSVADIALTALKKQFEEHDRKQTTENNNTSVLASGGEGGTTSLPQHQGGLSHPTPKRRFHQGEPRHMRERKKYRRDNEMVVNSPGYPFMGGGAYGGDYVARYQHHQHHHYQEVPAIVTQLDHRLSVKHQQTLPDGTTTTVIGSLIRITNEFLGILREPHQLVEFKLTKAFAKGLLTKDELVLDAVVIFAQKPTKQMINILALELKPMYDVHTVEVRGSIIVISNGVITLNLATTFLQAWQCEFKYLDPHSMDYVDIEACQTALLNIRQVLWFEPNFLRICAPNPRIIAKLFHIICRRSPELRSLSPFEQLVIIYWALKDPPPASGLSNALRRIFSYLASGDLYLASEHLINPVKDHKVHLFTKLTREEERILSEFVHENKRSNTNNTNTNDNNNSTNTNNVTNTNDNNNRNTNNTSTITSDNVNNNTSPNTVPPPPPHLLPDEIQVLLETALEPDPDKVIPIVEWAQRTIKLIAFEQNAWETLLGGLPPEVPSLVVI